MWDDFVLFVAVGFAAQLVDGAIGMAYGVSATTVLLSLGDAEQPDLAVLDGGDPGGIERPRPKVGQRPHDVRRGGGDLALVGVVRPVARPVRREQGILAHHARQAPAENTDAFMHA
jgi:hypothetical protein